MTADSDGVWRVDVEVARDAVTGKRRRASRTVRGTRQDAEIMAAKLKLADHEQRLITGKTNARSVAAALEQYVHARESGAIEVAPSTVVTSRSAIKTMSATEIGDGREFGSLALSQLGWREIEQLHAGLKTSGRGNDWIRRCATVLSQSLEFGRMRGLLESNPAKDAQRPKSTRTKPFSPSAAELRTALAGATDRDPEMADMARLLASTGMRRGELLALRWTDVDLARREVSVAAALVDGGKGVGIVCNATKNTDWRDVPMTDSVWEALDRQRSRAEAQSRLASDDFVFVGDLLSGAPVRPDALSKRWSVARGPSQITLRLHYDGRTDVGKRKAIAALELD